MKKVLIICILLIAAGCQVDDSAPDLSPSPSPTPRPPTLTGLRSFEDCQALQTHLASLSNLGPVPLMQPLPDGSIEAHDTGDSEASISVEEGDIIRQADNRLYVMTEHGDVLIYDTSVPAFPQRLGQIPLQGWPSEIQIDGNRLAAIVRHIPYEQGIPWTTVSLFDVSDGSAPQLISTKDYSGTYDSSRLVGQVLYMALNASISIDDWDATQAIIGPCEDVRVPLRMEETQTLPSKAWTLIGLDMQADAQEPARITVLGGWRSNILASPEHFYLANYLNQPGETAIHLFQISPQQATIQPWSHATVPGDIINQHAMDESHGVLRIASTDNPWMTPSMRNYLTTFDVSDSSLKELGQIDSITPDEWISAVRFTEDYAFLTTFITIDPLVIVDLRNPEKPEVLGELEVLGMAHYIEVWGDRLITIGQTDAGCGNVLLTLFDISDLKEPQLIDQLTLEANDRSEALRDHRAHTFHPDFELLALPLSVNGAAPEMGFFHVDPEHGFTDLGSLDHGQLLDDGEERYVRMRRSLRVANHHYSISEAGISVSSFFDLTDPVSEIAYPELEADDFTPVDEIVFAAMCFMP